MADQPTYFKVPTSPEQFGVVLPPAELRRINFSALDFPTLRRAVIEYIKTYYPDQFNDFVANNGVIMFVELISYIGSILSTRSDVIADEDFLPTCQTELAAINHLALINQVLKRQTPAVVEVEVFLNNPVSSEIRIPAGYVLSAPGADGKSVTYELFRAPNDFTSYLSIPPNKRGIIGWAIEGKFAVPLTVVSAGGPSQTIDIIGSDILSEPIIVNVTTGNLIKQWKMISVIERANPTDEVFEAKFLDDRVRLIFGDDIAGKSLLAGQTVTISCRRGGGIRGRIGSNAINRTDFINLQPPASAPVSVTFRNINPSNGGLDKETVDGARKRAPREAATIGRAVSGEDYSVLARNYNHPVFGSVLRAIAVVRTSINANIVELYVLAVGPGNTPVLPSIGLKKGLVGYFDGIKVLTDEVRVLDGAVKPVNLDANVIVDRNAVPEVVKSKVLTAIADFFNISNFDLGQGLSLSSLYKVISSIDGVKSVVIFTPVDDIIPTKLIANPQADGIGFNEIITLGRQNIRFYFESFI